MNLFWMTLITFVILQVSVLSTTIYLHRTLAHKGMTVHPALAALIQLHLVLFTSILPRQWVAVHRKHHHFSDRDGDPHSPYLLGLWQVFLGNLIYYRREAHNPATVMKYTQDYRPTIIDRLIPAPVAAWGILGGLGIFMLLFGWAWGLAAWIFQMVAYVLLNSAINSFCHMIGYRNFDNLATNIRWVALITGGEGLHNNHHQYPASARLAMRRREFDPAWPVIRLLAMLGLAQVKPLPEQIAKAA